MESERKEIPLPKHIFDNRKNSSGLDISEIENLKELKTKLKSFDNKLIIAKSLYEGREKDNTHDEKIFSISSKKEIGSVIFDDSEKIIKSLNKNSLSSWQESKPENRYIILNKIADDIEEDPYEIIYYLINEAGKTIQNAVDEIREAVDFLRYYSNQILKISDTSILEGPTGEENIISYTPKGRFLCISPWNFPVAILIGQISAALACGNKVIVKPSEHTSILGLSLIHI